MNEPTQFIVEGLRGELRQQVSMRRHTSWRAGGIAQRVYRPADLADLQNFLQHLSVNEPLMAVGLGSNLLVRDGGLRGTVLLMHGVLNALRMDGEYIYAQAGVTGAKLARLAAANNLCGAEFFAGIPGTVGGMLAMNAGCYGGETWDVVQRAQVLTRNGELLERIPADYDIGYRSAALKDEQEEFFVGVWLRLKAGDGEVARRDVKALLEKRMASQPLHLPNAGSVFRNPEGDHAARLIESCGLKSKCIGGAQISPKHANFIVNTGKATAADIENLIEVVRDTVVEKAGVLLHSEVKIVGDAEVMT